MYIIAIAWMYVVVLMAAAQDSLLAGIATLIFYGLLPCSVLMYLLAAPRRAKTIKSKNKTLANLDQESAESTQTDNPTKVANRPEA